MAGQSTIPEPTPAAVGSISAAESIVPASEGQSWPAVPVVDIKPRTVKRHHINDDVAEMLATLPRKRWDESTWAAFGGAVAALPSAAEAIHAGYEREPFSLHGFEIVQVMIFIGFFIWFLARRGSKKEKTSTDLLNELRYSDEKSQGSAGG
jgi:hypothetical protein